MEDMVKLAKDNGIVLGLSAGIEDLYALTEKAQGLDYKELVLNTTDENIIKTFEKNY